MTWLAAWAFVKNAAGGLFGFLKSLDGWQLVCLALALLGAVQTVRVWSEQRHSAKVESQLAKSEAARHADQEAYAKAQADAQAANKAPVSNRLTARSAKSTRSPNKTQPRSNKQQRPPNHCSGTPPCLSTS